LVAAVKQARLSADDNVLILVDQFEELFRFRRSRQIENSRDEAVAFVKLLLEAARQTPVPIYVVLTMRSDFIGDCMDYPGLPEAINESHYLVPRMTRDALRSVITGPIAVAGGKITPRLVLRLLNDLGDNQDELPLLQHVLMRMWNHWQRQERRNSRSTSRTTRPSVRCAKRSRSTPKRRTLKWAGRWYSAVRSGSSRR
jgi:hypothetical protein